MWALRILSFDLIYYGVINDWKEFNRVRLT